MNSKNRNSDFCYEFIHELNIYEFTNLISWENLWFSIKSTQQQLSAAAECYQVLIHIEVRLMVLQSTAIKIEHQRKLLQEYKPQWQHGLQQMDPAEQARFSAKLTGLGFQPT